jgi:hypothetical protein
MLAAFYGYGSIATVFQADDFTWYWLGGRALIEGKDPYSAVASSAYGAVGPFMYPLTTAMLATPFALLSPRFAAAAFIGVGAALLSWGITRDDYNKLPIFGSAPFIWVCHSGQISPWITAGALIPGLAWIAPAKPTIGLAALAFRPTKWALAGSALFIVASLFINPHWPREWILALTNWSRVGEAKGIPVILKGGPLLLLALTRWRRPEARMFLVLACVPQTILFYDQLLLWLIPRTRLESMTLGLLSFTGLLLGNFALPPNPTWAESAAIYWPMILATCYLPALAMIMRRPNVSHQNGEPLPPN